MIRMCYLTWKKLAEKVANKNYDISYRNASEISDNSDESDDE